ncbi:MAG: MFS transporter [Anaerolineaceae bacterium]
MSNFQKITKTPALLTIGAAESISGIGDWITLMAVYANLVFRGGGGVAQSSGILLAGLLPILLASPFAGWLCDRYNRKHLMIASLLISGLMVSGLIFTTRLEIIYLLLALQAVSISVMSPARQAAIPSLVPPEDFSTVNAFLQQLSSIIKIAAPVLAGLVLTVLTPNQAIILDVISFALAALILIRLPDLPPAAEKESAVPREKKERNPAWKFLWSSGGLRLLFSSVFTSILVIIAFDVMASVFVRDYLGRGEQFFGLSIGLVGIGTLLSSVYLMTRSKKRNLWADVALGIILLAVIPFSLSFGIFAGNPQVNSILVLASCLVGGMGNGFLHIQVNSLLQLLSPAPILGRVSGLYQSTAVAGQLIGIVLTPILVPALLSIGSYFIIATVVLVLLAATVLVKSRSLDRSTPVIPATDLIPEGD